MRVQRFCEETVITIGRGDRVEDYQDFLSSGVIVVRDEQLLQSPLIGMLTGLRRVKSDYALVLPCDLPFVNEPIVRLLFKRASGYEASVPKWPNGNIEPLHSVYDVSSAELAAEETIRSGQLKVSRMIERLERVVYVDTRELRTLDKDLLTFFNINARQDLRKAKRILKLSYRFHQP